MKLAVYSRDTIVSATEPMRATSAGADPVPVDRTLAACYAPRAANARRAAPPRRTPRPLLERACRGPLTLLRKWGVMSKTCFQHGPHAPSRAEGARLRRDRDTRQTTRFLHIKKRELEGYPLERGRGAAAPLA